MPTPTAHPSPFLERLVLFLLPYFAPVCDDEAAARAEILETLASYGGRARSEVINAARIIAFSFSALDTLTEAKDPALSPSLRLRYKGCANGLNRSCQQNEQTLAKRLAYDPPEAVQPDENLVNDLPDPDFDAAIQLAEVNIASYRDSLATTRSPKLPNRPLPQSEKLSNQQLWGKAMMNVLAEMGMPVQPAGP